MKDREIRKILIEYLKASNSRIRVFQEKSIGTSVCDVMAVTDCLTGYEIKSDADNYQRFESQRHAYDRFFDQNYIVVGESHVRSASFRYPRTVFSSPITSVSVIRSSSTFILLTYSMMI